MPLLPKDEPDFGKMTTKQIQLRGLRKSWVTAREKVTPLARFAATTIATAPSPALSGTTLVVADGDGARFPSVPFFLLIWSPGIIPDVVGAEIVQVTSTSGDTFTITRTQEGTFGRTIVEGDRATVIIGYP